MNFKIKSEWQDDGHDKEGGTAIFSLDGAQTLELRLESFSKFLSVEEFMERVAQIAAQQENEILLNDLQKTLDKIYVL